MDILQPFVVTLAVIYGLVIGSFLNVVIWRVPNKKSLLPGSACPRCGAKITAWQNIPVVSWLLLRGRCHNCKEPISMRYPLVELGTGVLFGAAAAVFYPTTAAEWVVLAALLIFAAMSVTMAMIDFDTHLLLNIFTYPTFGVLTGLLALAAGLSNDWPRFGWAMLSAVVLMGLYLLLALAWPGGMGLGDVKLAASIGLICGWFGIGAVATAWFATFVLAGIFGLAIIAVTKDRKRGIPFGPWMLLGAWLGLLLGPTIFGLYLDTFSL
jgi:leader peptidase (prepilin peptidase)/N-methyltransferase